MIEMNPTIYLYLGAFLFFSGLLIVLVKRSAVFVLMGIELMLNAANLNLVVFSRLHDSLDGIMFSVFSVVLAAGEICIAFAILLNIYRNYQSTDLEQLDQLKH